jgi:hypothetical protein
MEVKNYDGTVSSAGPPNGASIFYNGTLDVNSNGDIYFENVTQSTTGVAVNVPSDFDDLS